jgi:DNA-binding HxlR family transcriptional regulator
VQKKKPGKDSTEVKQPERCFVEVTLEVIGGKWKPMILWHLIQGTKRFSEVKRLMPQVTQQMLTAHLRELEAHGVVHRKVYAQVPPKVEYSATDLGKSLEPILNSMHDWGERFVESQGG